MDTSTTCALVLEDQKMNSRHFNVLENSGMTSGGRGKFSIDFKAHNETSVEKHPLQRGFSLTYVNQEDKASVSEISDPLKVT